jgi:hypothetical protein
VVGIGHVCCVEASQGQPVEIGAQLSADVFLFSVCDHRPGQCVSVIQSQWASQNSPAGLHVGATL